MHPYLTRLAIRPEVQGYFRPFYACDEVGNLLFSYGNEFEHFGFAFHKVPLTETCWLAGNLNFAQVRFVIICGPAMDAVSWLNKKFNYYSSLDNLLFLSTGAAVQDAQVRWIREHLRNKEFLLVFGNDLLGRIADLKIAAGIRNLQVAVYLSGEEVLVSFRSRTFSFRQDAFSLNAFEKVAKYRFGMATEKPKNHTCFFDELKAHAQLTF